MAEQVDLRVHDRVALDEIELYSEVLSAVAASDRPLTAEELDHVLGVDLVRTARPSRVAEHDVGVPVREAQRLVQPDRGHIRLFHVEHDPGQAPRS
jgi:hypothetical protein